MYVCMYVLFMLAILFLGLKQIDDYTYYYTVPLGLAVKELKMLITYLDNNIMKNKLANND